MHSARRFRNASTDSIRLRRWRLATASWASGCRRGEPGACLTQLGAAGNDASIVERPRSTQRGNRRRYSERLRLVRWLVGVLVVGVTACGATSTTSPTATPPTSPTTNASALTSVDLAASVSRTIPTTEPEG